MSAFTDSKGRQLFIEVPITSLIVEDYLSTPNGYQRKSHGAKWVDDRTVKYDPEFVRPLEIADLSHEGKPGFFALIDGQGRKQLLEASGEPTAVGHVHYETDLQRRAELFIGLGDMSKLKYEDTFHARVANDDPVACAISKLFTDAGFNLNIGAGGGVSGLSTVQHVYEALKAPILRSVIHLFEMTWLASGMLATQRLPGQYVAGLAKIFEITNGGKTLDLKRLAEKLNDFGPAAMKVAIREDNGGKQIRTDQVPLAFAMNLATRYNACLNKGTGGGKTRRSGKPSREYREPISLAALRGSGDGKNF